MTATGMKPLAEIIDRDAVYQDVHDIVDNDNEPASHPRRRVRMKAGFRAFGPWRAARPWPIFQPCNMTRQVPAINDEVRTAYDGERVDILSYEKKRQDVKCAVHECCERLFCFFEGHPLALQQVIANGVSY